MEKACIQHSHNRTDQSTFGEQRGDLLHFLVEQFSQCADCVECEKCQWLLHPNRRRQLAPLAWGNINKISITFSQNVIVAQTDLKLVGVNVANYSFANFSYNSVTDTATWTLTAPIAADKVLIDLSDSVHNSSNTKLDGEWTDGVSKTSGDGTAGGRFDFRFNVLPGDATQSGSVDNADFTALFNHFGFSTGLSFADGDFDGDGDVDTADFTILFNNFTKQLPATNPTPPPVAVATQIAATAAHPARLCALPSARTF